MKTIKAITLACTILLFGCGPRVTTETTNATDKLDTYETFAYLPNSNFDELTDYETDKSVGTAVIESVNQNMKRQGYRLDRSNPDVLVLLTTLTDLEKSVTQDPIYATYPSYYGRNYAVSPYYQNYYYQNYYNYNQVIAYDTDVTRYKEGTLILRLVDADSKKIVWEGKASDAIFQQDESVAISEFVDDMFDAFPQTR